MNSKWIPNPIVSFAVMRWVWMALEFAVVLADSFQGIPEEGDAQCFLSKKRVPSAPILDMIASRAGSHARLQHTSVLQQDAKVPDVLDHISWDQQLREYRMVADDVAPVPVKDRCPLQRVDVQKASRSELKHLDKPVIFTNVFDTDEDWMSDLSKARTRHITSP